MVKNMIRAKRRAQLARYKQRARRIYPWCENPAKYANHLASCSCWMCGNPRKYLGERTLQEMKAMMMSEE